ncbi:putative sodium-dependent multivitamin transporter [Planococcus citri]|uniref:putative sodium-dependent multivitamin transporter n=1 Tax=Planococcus citri TaxID=170843 RepID=UPI0031F83229
MLKILSILYLSTLLALPISAKQNYTDRFDVCHDELPKHSFSIMDYVVLAIMLIISCAIGTFYGFFAKKQETSSDFLLGGSNMGTLPMSLSLAASFITAIELLGNPAEMYKFGTQFWTICFAFLFVVPITTKFYLPVYMKLRLTSSFEYLELRFNRQVRLFAALMYALQMTLYTSVTVYAPAIALSHVTGMGVLYAVSLVYCVCIFYSSQGGMKAVIMTDTFQAAVLMISLFLIMILGQMLVGSVYDVFNIVAESGRIELSNLNPSLTERHSIWTQVIGGIAYWVPMFCSNQASIQKYLSVKTTKQVRIALWVSAISLVVIYTINFYTGMIVFTEYHECDPLNKMSAGESVLQSKDEILPFYVMNVLGRYDGVPGFFVAGIFAASLGTVASALNSLAAITMKDFLDAGLNIRVADNKGAALSKWISIVFGAISFLLIFVVRQMDSVLKAALTFNGIVGGINLGLFSLGMFLPWINSKGALAGSLLSLVFVSWIGINSQIAETEGYSSECDKPTFFNESDSVHFRPIPCDSNSDVFVLYRISYMWYSAIGLLITVVFGVLVSWCTGFDDPCRVPSDLLSPPFRKFYSKFSNHTKERLHIPIETKEEIQINQINGSEKLHFERVSSDT